MGGDSITLVVRISNRRKAMFKAPMFVFINEAKSYSIRGLNDNILEVAYQLGLQEWMDQTLFRQYFEDRWAFKVDVQHCTKVYFEFK